MPQKGEQVFERLPVALAETLLAVFPVRGQLVMAARLPLGLASQTEYVGQTCQGRAPG